MEIAPLWKALDMEFHNALRHGDFSLSTISWESVFQLCEGLRGIGLITAQGDVYTETSRRLHHFMADFADGFGIYGGLNVMGGPQWLGGNRRQLLLN